MTAENKPIVALVTERYDVGPVFHARRGTLNIQGEFLPMLDQY